MGGVEQEDQLDEEGIVKKVKDCRKRAKSAQSEWRDETRENYDMVAGKQWDEEDEALLKASNRAADVFNRLGTVIDAVSGSEVNNRQEVRYIPREIGDVATNEVLTSAANMDLSTGGDISSIRRRVLKESAIPVGTVPIYQAVVEAVNSGGGLTHLRVDDIFQVIEELAADGVDFITVHCGLTRAALEMLKHQGRITDIVSRGGAFMSTWMLHHDRENPLYENFDPDSGDSEKT